MIVYWNFASSPPESVSQVCCSARQTRACQFVSALVFVLRQRNLRSHRQDVCFSSRFILVVETDSAIWTEVVGVSCSGGKPAFDAIHAAARDHFALAID